MDRRDYYDVPESYFGGNYSLDKWASSHERAEWIRLGGGGNKGAAANDAIISEMLSPSNRQSGHRDQGDPGSGKARQDGKNMERGTTREEKDPKRRTGENRQNNEFEENKKRKGKKVKKDPKETKTRGNRD